VTPRSGARLIELVVPETLAGERVDKAISLLAGISRREAADLVAGGEVSVDGRVVKVRSRVLTEGELLEVRLLAAPRPVAPGADPDVRFKVVQEDRSMVVVDKPPGLVVHAGAGNETGTLVNGLLARYPDLAELPKAGAGDPDRPGIVHRLDKGTSGLMVVARTVEAYLSLSKQFKEHSAGRTYTALVHGALAAPVGVVDAPIGRSARRPDRMAVASGGKPALTEYRELARYSTPVPATLLEATLSTGRTHQVRVHLAAIGHPVLGDDRYGGRSRTPSPPEAALPPGRLFLHATRLELEDLEGRRRSWESPLPEDLERSIEAFS
jgi:23S rRNA pseudouridine1911/1915/1917 synthase